MEQKTKAGFSLYINSNENFQKAAIIQDKKKKYRKVLLITLAVVCVLSFFAYRYRTYHSMKVVKSITKDLSESVKSFAYKSGTISYSEDGVSFLDGNGQTKWNQTFSLKNPIASYCKEYIVIASKNGNEVVLLDADGHIKQFSVSHPIIDVEVASQGVIALILQGENANYIELYESAQKKLVRIKTTGDQNGYPMDIDLSSDGENLAVSYLVVDGIKTKSRIAFYNFGEDGQEKEDQLIAGFDESDTIIPKINFMGDSRLCAVGDGKLIIFKAGKSPSKQKEVKIEKSVKSVSVNDKYIAMIIENQKKNDEEKFEAKIYNKSGREIMSKGFSSEYNKVVLGKKELMVTGNYHCSIFNFAGHEMFDKDFKKRILDISPTGKTRKYLVAYENKTELICLR